MVVAYRTGLIIFPQTIVIALTDVIYRRKTSTVRSSRDVHTQCGAESCRRADLHVVRTFYYNDTSVSARSVNAPLDVPNTREVYNII